ncbi:hypothetical protein INT44_007339 [Umbelopsis vinacea]|uniref:Non-structural maintenance of chromosomes element 1 homolog n=1 Tax=Umbelopsis vinacea TaxID=44442 RepID=A0A8H7UBD7_9FUNG|nr:hypothetical protein INT44_007339 [Umbelopsis vinacea]
MNGQEQHPHEMAEYNGTHRLFMQSMLSHRILKESQAEVIYEKICDMLNVEKADFGDLVAVINKEISDVDLALRRTVDEYDSSAIIALVNTRGDEVAQLATTYSANEIGFFKRVLELIVTADDEAFSLSSMAAIREGPKLKPALSQRETEELLNKLVADKWLMRRRDGYYVLHMRSIIELQNYLKETFENEIHECLMCMEIVTVGERCSQGRCEVRLHSHCAAGYFPEQDNGSEIKCPTCGTTWARDSTIGTIRQ